MSGKSARIVKKEQAPRALEEIQRDYQDHCVKAGHVQYQIKVLSDELKSLNELMIDINKEAAKRQDLDKQAKAASDEQV